MASPRPFQSILGNQRGGGTHVPSPVMTALEEGGLKIDDYYLHALIPTMLKEGFGVRGNENVRAIAQDAVGTILTQTVRLLDTAAEHGHIFTDEESRMIKIFEKQGLFKEGAQDRIDGERQPLSSRFDPKKLAKLNDSAGLLDMALEAKEIFEGAARSEFIQQQKAAEQAQDGRTESAVTTYL